jgi:hypothetical protein
MPTHKDAKTMARSLRGALADRNVPLSHSECLEIVARQFGFADWNTLSAKLPAEEGGLARSQARDTAAPTAVPARTPSPVTESVPEISIRDVETHPETDATSQKTPTAAPWSKCSFCGKSWPEVRTLMGGCGGWEGFRARRGPERSNVFICDACVTLAAQTWQGLPTPAAGAK